MSREQNTRRDCLVVGAGIAGLLAAQQLKQAGHDVLVLDKSRGVGGRMATRRVENAVFDHGAQYFTARSPEFRAVLQEWLDAGVITHWFASPPSETGDATGRYIGTQGMTTLPKHLAAGLAVQRDTFIRAAEADSDAWALHTDNGVALYGRSLIVTAPVPQGLEILRPVAASLDPALVGQLSKVRYAPCFTLMLSLDGPSGMEAPGFVHAPAPGIACMSDNQLKGISNEAVSISIIATPEFSSSFFDEEPDSVAQKLYDMVSDMLQSNATSWQLQRWRYSKVLSWLYDTCLLSTTPLPIAYAGDAFVAPRIEGAALSGMAAGAAVAKLLDQSDKTVLDKPAPGK